MHEERVPLVPLVAKLLLEGRGRKAEGLGCVFTMAALPPHPLRQVRQGNWGTQLGGQTHVCGNSRDLVGGLATTQNQSADITYIIQYKAEGGLGPRPLV